MSTTVGIRGENFTINGKLTYSELPSHRESSEGLLFNARFIQGIFDDKADPGRFARFGFESWDADAQTDRLIAALPEWYSYGLRAFTVGIQGGGPCFTISNDTINNNPFGADGASLESAYAARLDRLIRGADSVGMVVIVSFFYGSQAARLEDGKAIRQAVTTASRFLRDGGYTNVIIEVANEQNIGAFNSHPIVKEPEGMSALIDLARAESGGMAVGCSGGGGGAEPEICRASDVILIHGNGQTRQQLYNLVQKVRDWAPGKPVVCNEDSQAIGQLLVADQTHSSWGYYNNMSKQEPPTRWNVLPGEDTFFALRVAEIVGIDIPEPSKEDQFYLHGFEDDETYENMRWIRLASLYPERIDYVVYRRNGEQAYIAYDEPFSVNFRSNWRQGSVDASNAPQQWEAEIHLRDGSVITKSGTIQ